MATFTSTTNGNLADGATYGNTSPGVRGTDFPGDDDVLVVDSGDTVTMNADATIGSVDIQGTLTTDGTARTLTLDDGGQGYICEHRGTVSTTINLTINSNFAGNRLIRLNNGGNGNFNNVSITLESAARVLEFVQSTTIDGNLTILLGKLQPYASTYSFTVTGTTTIGPGSGVADQATLNCSASTISLGALRQQADYAVNIENGGTFTGGTGANHTFGSLFMSQSATAKATMTTGEVLVNGYNNSANKAWRVEYGGDTFDNANGTVKFQFNGFDSRMSMRGESHANNAFHNLIIHMNGDTRQISPDNGNKIIVDNDLTITRGKLVMGMNHALEVGGNAVIDDASDTAELEMGSSSNISSQAVTFGSLTIGNTGTYKATSGTTTITDQDGGSGSFSFKDEGTFTHNSGTVKIDFNTPNKDASTRIHQNGAKKLNNVEIDMNRTTDEVTWSVASGTSQGIAGNFTLTKGESYLYSLAHDFDVDGDFLVGANGTWGSLGHSGAHEAKSLTISSGGTYMATSGTTTITGRTSGGYSWYSPTTGSTFTHNNGKVKLNYTGNETYWQGTGFYDLEIDGSTHYEHRYDDLTDGSGLTIFNNFTITEGRVRFNQAGDNVTVHGLTKMVSGQYGNTGTAPSGTHNYGNVVIEGGTWKVTSGTCNMSGIRKLGGTLA